MSDLRETVKQAILKASGNYAYDWTNEADAAIRAVIEALAAEADGQFHAAFMFNGSDTMTGLWMEVSDWLREHIGGMETSGE